MTSANDETVLQTLALQQAEIASLPIQQKRRRQWTALSALRAERPMVEITQIPWHEMNVEDELTLRCQDPFLRQVEEDLRRRLYQWRHMPGDMVMEPVLYCPFVVHNSGFGLREDVDIQRTDEASEVVSRHFHIQIRDEEDLQKIQTPVITVDHAASQARLETMRDIFHAIIPVQQRGTHSFWFAPWDELVRWWGVQEVLTDMIDRPELVHHGIQRLVNAYLGMLDQYVALGLVSPGHEAGSAHAYSDELEENQIKNLQPATMQQWGIGAAQIFSEVSPAMHEEFAMQYEKVWFARFGLNYYGCCEPLHRKVDLAIKHIPRLRKISMSPWVDRAVGAEHIGSKLVYSAKPNPSIFVDNAWSEQAARQDLQKTIDITGQFGCPLELIMKDISTVSYRPDRLWAWSRIALELTCGEI